MASNGKFTFALMSGGEGRRFGSDKTKALLGGKPLYMYGLELGLSLTDDVIHVSRNPVKYEPFIEGIQYISDELPNQCPMAGMITAAIHAKYDTIFVLSADSPLFTEELVKFIVNKSFGFNGAIPIVTGKNYNLAAAYSRQMLLDLKAFYDKGLYRLKDCCDTFNVKFINENEFTSTGFSIDLFININTYEDIELASKIISN